MFAACAGILVCGGLIARAGQPFGSFSPLVHLRRMLCFYLSSKQSSVAGPAHTSPAWSVTCVCHRARTHTFVTREALRYVVSYVPLRCSIASVASSVHDQALYGADSAELHLW